ncbi:hypothetical protein RHSIM_Rhsim02G0026800 [Rhododendron simsii]|uniref:Bifunctional inhibitor/plant lipid transfer protein/seed storage helical domain-containing protein n=1 Tax=Rhododendron simsii TaxID=118357 RepID=A0A834HCS3_RHOSS|nr:hypothetical protein RHSIM_Rhsim02G0026800 [Rhododendron simsii]
MAKTAPFLCFFSVLVIASTVMKVPVYAQISIPCTTSMVSSFTPCINFVTNSSSTGASPTAGCCTSLASILSGGTDCMCQMATGATSVIPINRTLALSLPKACKMSRVPLQCKASPIPAPGPIAFTPTAPVVPNTVSPALAPEADGSSTVEADAPTADSGIRPVLNPSAARPSYQFSPSLLLALLAALVLKFY